MHTMHILFCVPLLLNSLGKYQVANIVENIDDRNNPMDTGKKNYIFLFDSFLNIYVLHKFIQYFKENKLSKIIPKSVSLKTLKLI